MVFVHGAYLDDEGDNVVLLPSVDVSFFYFTVAPDRFAFDLISSN